MKVHIVRGGQPMEELVNDQERRETRLALALSARLSEQERSVVAALIDRAERSISLGQVADIGSRALTEPVVLVEAA
jgi:hypothetical protein